MAPLPPHGRERLPIESLEACLSWCSRNLANDEAGLKAFADRLEENFAQIRADFAQLTQQRTVKEAYSVEEVAEKLGKAAFTVREWCRQERIHVDKRACGRGQSQEWKITHAELVRVQNEGLLPVPKH